MSLALMSSVDVNHYHRKSGKSAEHVLVCLLIKSTWLSLADEQMIDMLSNMLPLMMPLCSNLKEGFPKKQWAFATTLTELASMIQNAFV